MGFLAFWKINETSALKLVLFHVQICIPFIITYNFPGFNRRKHMDNIFHWKQDKPRSWHWTSVAGSERMQSCPGEEGLLRCFIPICTWLSDLFEMGSTSLLLEHLGGPLGKSDYCLLAMFKWSHQLQNSRASVQPFPWTLKSLPFHSTVACKILFIVFLKYSNILPNLEPQQHSRNVLCD